MIGPSLWWRLVVTALWCVAHGRYKGNLPLRCTWNEVGGGAYRLLWSRITNVVTGLVLYISDFQSKLCSRLLCQLTVWQLYYVGHCRYIRTLCHHQVLVQVLDYTMAWSLMFPTVVAMIMYHLSIIVLKPPEPLFSNDVINCPVESFIGNQLPHLLACECHGSSNVNV